MDYNQEQKQDRKTLLWAALAVLLLLNLVLVYFIYHEKQENLAKDNIITAKTEEVLFIKTKLDSISQELDIKIAEIQKMMNITPMKDQVQFISITTDPKRDSGQVLRYYGDNHGLDPANWTFLTAAPGEPEDATRKIALSYGLKFVETEDGLQMHGVVTHVIDQDGRLRARFHGLKFQPLNLVIYTNALVNKVQMPHADDEPGFWDRLKEMF